MKPGTEKDGAPRGHCVHADAHPHPHNEGGFSFVKDVHRDILRGRSVERGRRVPPRNRNVETVM